MAHPVLPLSVKHAVEGLDARLDKLEAKSAEIDQRTRRSAAEGALDREQALAAIMVSTQMSETRDAEIIKAQKALSASVHQLGTHMRGTDLELAKQGADLRVVRASTARLNGILAHPTVRLVIQAIVLIGAAYATEMARQADKQNTTEPAHTAAPMHP
jgi:multidrug resistance efflux pump